MARRFHGVAGHRPDGTYLTNMQPWLERAVAAGDTLTLAAMADSLIERVAA